MRVTASVIIDQPIRVVFASIADPSCWPKWMTNVSAIERRSARSLDVGETFDRVDHPAGHGLWSTWEVTEYEPPRLLGCRRIAGGPRSSSARCSNLLMAPPDSRCAAKGRCRARSRADPR